MTPHPSFRYAQIHLLPQEKAFFLCGGRPPFGTSCHFPHKTGKFTRRRRLSFPCGGSKSPPYDILLICSPNNLIGEHFSLYKSSKIYLPPSLKEETRGIYFLIIFSLQLSQNLPRRASNTLRPPLRFV